MSQGRRTDLYFPIEATRPTQCRVQCVGSVSRSDDDDALVLSLRLHAIHDREQLRDDALLDLAAGPVLAARAQRVHLVEHDDARRAGSRLREDVAQLRLCLAVVGRRELGPIYGEQRCARGGRDGAREVRLACAGWTME